ncbi:MAG: ATP-grasp domain-containing protein [Longimicrobiales bacterium]
MIVQPYVHGEAASVSVVSDGRRAIALAVNAQAVRPGIPFVYDGGETPLVHPMAPRAAERAIAACEAIPALVGSIGVDVVLTPTDAVVIEINPRLTTAYIGVRRALDVNPAALALAACTGRWTTVPPAAVRSVRFTAGGIVESAEAVA